MNNMQQKPVLILGQYYKNGLGGKVFVQREHDWCLSHSVTADQVRQAIEAKKNKKPRKDNRGRKLEI